MIDYNIEENVKSKDNTFEVEYFYDKSIDTLGIKVKREYKYYQTIEMGEGILLDFDIENLPTALEILNASRKLNVPKESFDNMHCFNMKVCIDKKSIFRDAIFGFRFSKKKRNMN